MSHTDPQLDKDVFNVSKLDQAATRDGFGHGLVEAGKKDERVVALCADLAESTRTHWFREEFPERYVELGVAEQNLATVASGMANYGKIPFIMSYAAFSPGRNNEQIRTTIALNNVGIIAIGSMVHQALLAARELTEEGVATSVLNVATIKPLDKKTIIEFAKHCGAVVTVEEHQITGGLGSAVAECLASEHPKPIEFVGVHDRFGQSGNATDLYKEYGLTVSDIKIAVKKVRSRK
jgi:transketolase C-terminal domain/subunit